MSFTPGALRLHAAVQALSHGGVVACPTEAVWGLSCDPQDEFAIARVLELKNRPRAKGLILVAGSCQQLDYLTHDLASEQQEQLAEHWPGPVTFLVPHYGRVSPWVSGEHDTEQLDNLLPGRIGAAARPSSIRDLVSGQIVRD